MHCIALHQINSYRFFDVCNVFCPNGMLQREVSHRCASAKLSTKGGGVVHHFVLTSLKSLKRYRAIWGIAAIISRYCDLYRTKISLTILSHGRAEAEPATESRSCKPQAHSCSLQEEAHRWSQHEGGSSRTMASQPLKPSIHQLGICLSDVDDSSAFLTWMIHRLPLPCMHMQGLNPRL